MRIGLLDTETTGLTLHPKAPLDKQPKIIEFGGIIYDEHGEEICREEFLVKVGEPLDPVVTKITGITDEMLETEDDIFAYHDTIRKFIHTCDMIGAHNMVFDKQIVDMEFWRIGDDLTWPRLFCTVEEFQQQWGYRPSLQKLYHHVTGEPLAQTHRACDDIEAMAAIMRKKELFRIYADAMRMSA